MKRRTFLKSLIVTVIAPSVLKAAKPEHRGIAYSENIIFCPEIPYEELELVIECNKPIKVTLEESDDRSFCEPEACNPRNMTKNYIRAKYEWIGSPVEVTTYLRHKGSPLAALDYERELT